MGKVYSIFLKNTGFGLIAMGVLLANDSAAQLAKDKCKFLGNVIGGSVPSNFAQYWNQVTPENSGKWGSVESTRDDMSWSGLETAYNFAKNNGFPFKQHTFIWGNQQPAWIESLPQEEQLEEIEEWISSYCEKFPDTDYIEVVNEPINDPPNSAGNGGGNYFNALGGAGATGYDWIITSFEMAREHCPNASLLINEYNVINNNQRTDQYVTIINLLKDKELIDGIGVQGHRFEVESAPLTQLDANLDKLGATGLPVYITEFDLGNIGGEGTPDDQEQLDLYEEVFPALWKHPAVQGITLWGYIQGQIWQTTAYLQRSNGSQRPAFDWLENYVENDIGGTFCLDITGLKDDEALRVSLYPNPSHGGNVKIEFEEKVSLVKILDHSGKVFHEIAIQPGTRSLDLDMKLAPGIYILQLTSGETTVFKKLIVN